MAVPKGYDETWKTNLADCIETDSGNRWTSEPDSKEEWERFVSRKKRLSKPKRQTSKRGYSPVSSLDSTNSEEYEISDSDCASHEVPSYRYPLRSSGKVKTQVRRKLRPNRKTSFKENDTTNSSSSESAETDGSDDSSEHDGSSCGLPMPELSPEQRSSPPVLEKEVVVELSDIMKEMPPISWQESENRATMPSLQKESEYRATMPSLQKESEPKETPPKLLRESNSKDMPPQLQRESCASDPKAIVQPKSKMSRNRCPRHGNGDHDKRLRGKKRSTMNLMPKLNPVQFWSPPHLVKEVGIRQKCHGDVTYSKTSTPVKKLLMKRGAQNVEVRKNMKQHGSVNSERAKPQRKELTSLNVADCVNCENRVNIANIENLENIEPVEEDDSERGSLGSMESAIDDLLNGVDTIVLESEEGDSLTDVEDCLIIEEDCLAINHDADDIPHVKALSEIEVNGFLQPNFSITIRSCICYAGEHSPKQFSTLSERFCNYLDDSESE